MLGPERVRSTSESGRRGPAQALPPPRDAERAAHLRSSWCPESGMGMVPELLPDCGVDGRASALGTPESAGHTGPRYVLYEGTDPREC